MLASWQEFLCGKRKRKDVRLFALYVMDNIVELHQLLLSKTYTHRRYHAFKINDPKPRDIHKACVRDRLVHHALYRILYPYFDRIFIYDSYSCRNQKGTHRALNRFRDFSRIVSQNNTRTVWILKCDIKKFFANINHQTLKNILKTHIGDTDTRWLLEQVIDSFCTVEKIESGLPLGNLTSQLLVNVYMNEFDHFVKRRLKAQYYIRYADDFVILSNDKQRLESMLPELKNFLTKHLQLELHPHKVSIKTLGSGIDFLGWIHFFDHRTLRSNTKRRMFRNIKNGKQATFQSYMGMLKHGNGNKLKNELDARAVKKKCN